MRKKKRGTRQADGMVIPKLQVCHQGVKAWSIALLAIAITVPLRSSAWAQTDQQKNGSSYEDKVDGCVDRKDGRFELTNSFSWVVYDLTGQTAGLENHIGDEVKVRGTVILPPAPPAPASSTQHRRPPILQVRSVEFIVHKNPEGVRPVLGNRDTWVGYDNPQYGVRVRYPPTFGLEGSGNPPTGANFAGQDSSASVRILSVNIPRSTFPDSNFADGVFAIFINPNIRSEGTCRQFATSWPEHTASTNIGRVSYARTLQDGVAMGTDYSGYQFHTFQHGLCYELAFEFAESNGGGMDIPCSIQWVSEDNLFELINGVLSQASYFTPKLERASAPSQEKAPPTITSFQPGQPFDAGVVMAMELSWKTQSADYVRLSYECVNNLYVSITSPTTGGYSIDCGEKAHDNSLPNGSVTLMLDNLNSAPVNVVLTIEPFLAGVGYPNESKSISVSVAPQHPLNSRSPAK